MIIQNNVNVNIDYSSYTNTTNYALIIRSFIYNLYIDTKKREVCDNNDNFQRIIRSNKANQSLILKKLLIITKTSKNEVNSGHNLLLMSY